MGTRPTLYLNSIDSAQELLNMLEQLVISNTSYLERHPRIPHPYQSGLYYDTEPEGQENWLGVEALLKAGWGDCEDLAAYLAGWYRARKQIMARVVLIRFTKGKHVWYHAVVKMPDGDLEDPSKVLGMKG